VLVIYSDGSGKLAALKFLLRSLFHGSNPRSFRSSYLGFGSGHLSYDISTTQINLEGGLALRGRGIV